MSKFNISVIHKPTIGGGQEIVTLGGMHTKLTELHTWDKIKLDDHNFYQPSWDNWTKIVNYLKPRVPKYYIDKFDCDNCADWFKVHAAEEFGINTMARVDGYADMGMGKGPERHAWCYFPVGLLFYQLEPQNGVIMDWDDPRYVPDEITMG